MRTLIFALAAAALLASHAGASPGEPPPGFDPGPDVWIARHAAEVGIDAATLERVRVLGEQHRAEREGIVGALHKQKLALRTLLEGGSASEAEAIALARQIGTLETDLSVARLTSMMRIHALLTPEQNAALREKMRGRFEQRRALLDDALRACEAELTEHCAGADGPPGHSLMCLLHKRRSEQLAVSEACEAALREIPPPPFMRHGALPPGARGGDFDVLVPPPAEGELSPELEEAE